MLQPRRFAADDRHGAFGNAQGRREQVDDGFVGGVVGGRSGDFQMKDSPAPAGDVIPAGARRDTYVEAGFRQRCATSLPGARSMGAATGAAAGSSAVRGR